MDFDTSSSELLLRKLRHRGSPDVPNEDELRLKAENEVSADTASGAQV